MSWWTSVNGSIIVNPMGRTQPEKKYILDTVLAHLPLVTGSERNMEIYVNQMTGYNSCCSVDEFSMFTDKLYHGWLETQDEYILTVNGSFRDRTLDVTVKEFMKWLCRLSKRIHVDSVLVRISDYNQELIINESDEFNSPYSKMFEDPSWSTDDYSAPNWCEYLMWKRWSDTPLPLEHICKYKYFDGDEEEAMKTLKERNT